MNRLVIKGVAVLFLAFFLMGFAAPSLRGVGDMGVVIERASGRVRVVETSHNTILAQVDGLGDLSHASVVFSRDGRHAFVFGRDGGLSKVDLLAGRLEQRVMQAGNSIGGAISQDGRLVAVANYTPGGIRIFDAETLEKQVADIPAVVDGKSSKVVGLADAPEQKFVFSLFDSDQIWVVAMEDPAHPVITRFENIGSQPYDGLITPDGRYYIAGLFGEDGLALLDLWHMERGVRKVMAGYGRGEEKLPVFKMPHLRGWAMASGHVFLPAVGHHEVLVMETGNWTQTATIPVHGQPVFVMARPDGRQVWVNFALPDNDTIQVIDVETLKVVETLKPGKGIMHMEFTPKGEHVWISERDEDRVEVFHTGNFKKLATLAMEKPSGIFLTARAHRIGM